MSARKRPQTGEIQTETQPPIRSRAPEFDTFNFYVEAVSPAFDPKWDLLRRFVFTDTAVRNSTHMKEREREKF
jgi:hypothetical protein